MAIPKLTLTASKTAIEGTANGIFTITLDAPAPAGGLSVSFNTLDSTAALNSDYTFAAGSNISALTANSFVIAAGASSANLLVQAKADAVTEGNETVSLTLNVGGSTTASFATQQTFPAGDDSYAVKLGDINGDGHLDVITANYSGHNVSVLLGDGKGSFAAQQTFLGSGNPRSIALGDFNNDGHVDVVTANYDATMSLFLGNGQGQLSAPQTFMVGDGTNSYGEPGSSSAYGTTFAIVGDINNDGKLDVMTANFYTHNVSLLLSNGQGGFASPQTFATGENPLFISLGDVNGDGILDVITTNYYTSQVSLLFGDGQGGFTLPQTFSVGNTPNSANLGDFNGDGHIDLLVANGSSNNVSLLLADGQGGFKTQRTFAVDNFPLSSELADVNGDSYLDVVTANVNTNNVSVLLGNGQTGFTTQQIFAVGTSPYSVSLGDVNEDGRIDIVTANHVSKNVSVLLNTTPIETAQTVSANLTITDNHLPTGIVSISDTTPEQGQTLTASNTLADVDGLNTISYAWLANGQQVGTGDSYTVRAADVGKKLSVTASYTDGLAKLESVSSANTGIVALAKLILQGTSGSDLLSGGAGNDSINGNAGNDLLDGDLGNDTLNGGNGNDLIHGDSGTDLLNGGFGNDLLDGGLGNDKLNGGYGRDILRGGEGDDILNGNAGNDELRGGAGKDSFIVNTMLAANIDKITDFNPVDDTIKLENAIFTQLTTTGVLNVNNFVVWPEATDNNDYVIYNKVTGVLLYDADGNGAGTALQIALLGTGLSLTNADFVVI